MQSPLCIHCSSDSHPSNSLEMKKEDCLRIITDASKMKVSKLTFSGGEPFLWSPLEDAIGKAIKSKIEVTIYTTGNSPNYKNDVQVYKRLGIKKLIFSLFGAEPRTHERITRKKNSFENTRNAILFANSQNIETQLHFVPTSRNYTEIENVVKTAYKLNVSQVSILRLVPQGRAKLSDSGLSKTQNIDIQQKIRKIREKIQIPDFIRTGSPYNFLWLNPKPHCDAATNRIIIGPDLRIFPCDAFKGIQAEEIVEKDSLSILTQCSLKQCWEKSSYLNAVRKAKDNHPAQCKKCSQFNQCLSGCLAQKAIKNKSLFNCPDPDCLMIAERNKE
jgi:radical SAM protein with 4Fe4S-binding SPASM domain